MRRKIVVLFVFLVVVLMACSLLSPAKVLQAVQQAAPTAAALATQVEHQMATTVPQPTEQPSSEEATSSPSSEIHGPMNDQSVHSFRATITVTLESKLVTQSPATIYQIEITKAQKPQPVTHLILKGGLPLTLEAEIYETKDGFYTRDPQSGEWITLHGEGFGDTVSGVADIFLSPQAALAMIFSRGKPTTYQGKPALQYHWVADTVASLQQIGLGENLLPSGQGLDDMQFDPKKVTVDAIVLQSGLVVKQVMRGEGQLTRNAQTAPATVTWQMVLNDVNADLNVPLPAELENQVSGANAPLPLPDSAQLNMSASGASIYTIPNTTVDDVLAFWQEQGLTIASKMGDAQNGMVVDVKKADGTQVKVLLSVDGKDVSVMFMP